MEDELGVILGPLKLLHPQEMKEILESENRADYVVAGYYDYLGKHLMLFKGDGNHVMVPMVFFANFERNPNIPVPDPEQLEIIDYGQTIKLGPYEAATDAILYDMDPEYKEKVNGKARD